MEKKARKPYLHLFLLSITAVVWGASFVSQKVGMGHVGPFTYNGIRMLIGGAVLLPVISLFRKRGLTRKVEIKEILAQRDVSSVEDLPWYDRKPAVYGCIISSIALFAATSFQHYAIQFSSVGKAGFIVSMYVVLVPLFSTFLGHRIKILEWLAVALALIGLYLLSIKGEFHISHGDIFLILGSISFSIHILIVRHYSPMIDGLVYSSAQFFLVGLISLPFMFILENPSWRSIYSAAIPILYSGVLSSGIGFTFQTLGLEKVPSNQAALITSQESTFSVLFGWLILNEALSGRELLGCAFMLAGVLLSQLAPGKEKNRSS